MDKQAWLNLKQHQIELYKERAIFHESKKDSLKTTYLITGAIASSMPFIMYILGHPLISLMLLILIPVTISIWKLSTHEIRSSQLLRQLADALEWEIISDRMNDRPLDLIKKAVTTVETRFLSNDDELFVKKAIWEHFMEWKLWKREEEIRYERALAEYYRHSHSHQFGVKPEKQKILPDRVKIGPVWNTDILHRQGYKDSNTIEDEWAIIKALRHLLWASSTVTHGVLAVTSALAQKNPVVFERYLRKKKISNKMSKFKRMTGVHHLSAAAKMRLVTFVEEVLALEPTMINETTVTLLHEKNEQIKKYTDDFWEVHNRSLKFYWFEALWMLTLVPFIVGAIYLLNSRALIEAIVLFTIGAALVSFGEMALVEKQMIKLNGKKLIPPLIASLIGSRHAMCADTNEEGIDNYRRRFKNLEKHFIMTTPEIDSVRYVKDNLRDEMRTSSLHAAEAICQEAQNRMDTYYKMFHLYRRKCLQFKCIELFAAIMLVSAFVFGVPGITIVFLFILIFGMPVRQGHIRDWRFKEMYFKIYQGLSVLIVDGELRLDPEKLNNMIREIEESALKAICTDHEMSLMVDTLSRVSGLGIPNNVKPHELDIEVKRIYEERNAERWSNRGIGR